MLLLFIFGTQFTFLLQVAIITAHVFEGPAGLNKTGCFSGKNEEEKFAEK